MARLIKPDGTITNNIPIKSVEEARQYMGCSIELLTFSKYFYDVDKSVEFWAFVDANREEKELDKNKKATLVIEQEIRGSALITSELEMLS